MKNKSKEKNRLVIIEINSGEKTCYSGGKPCRYIRVARFGQEFYCALFNDLKPLKDEKNMESGPGSLQRWQECINAEQKNFNSSVRSMRILPTH
jgi:hypothetical protein